MPFDEEDTSRSIGDSNAPAGSGWGNDIDPPIDSPRDKFRRERDSPDRRDRFGRDRRSRSRSPSDIRGSRRRSRSPIRRSSGQDDGDRYIPHYERDRDSGGRYGHRGYSGGRGNRGSTRGGDLDSPYSANGDGMGGRGGNFSSNGMLDPRSYDQVVPFKYFAEWLKTQDGSRRLEQEEIRERYEDYRREALQRLYTNFFAAHKDDDWFKERFDPERRKDYMQELAVRKTANLKDFLAALESGRFDKLTMTASTEQVMQHEVNRRDQSSSNRLGGDDEEDESESCCLFIRTVPPSVPRATLEEELKKESGFKYLALSEPRQDKQYHRFGWVRFEKGTDMEKVMDNLSSLKIDEFQFHFSRHTSTSSAAMRLVPDVASTEERLRHDLKLAREAVRSLDERTGPDTFHSLGVLQKKARELSAAAGELTSASGDDDDKMKDEPKADDGDMSMDDGEKKAAAGDDADDDGEPKINIDAVRRELDLLLEYLRSVHYYCYYCGHTADNSEDFARRCAKLHLRRPLQPNGRAAPSGNWTRNLDNRNDVIIHPLEAERLYKEGGKSLARETDKELDKHIKQLDEGRFRCLLCTKLFKGDAFVRKHIRNKHPEAVPESLVREIAFFNNFVREAPHFVQLGTGGTLSFGTAIGANANVAGAGFGGAGMRDRNAGFMPQMMPGMMIPGMMAAGPYMMPGMMPGMVAGMMPMGGHFMNPGMMGMMGGGSDRSQGGMYSQQYRGRGNSRGANGNRGDPRAVRSYVDLDAPAEGEPDFGF